MNKKYERIPLKYDTKKRKRKKDVKRLKSDFIESKPPFSLRKSAQTRLLKVTKKHCGNAGEFRQPLTSLAPALLQEVCLPT